MLFTRWSSLFIAAAPVIFVLLWSTGFIGAKLGAPFAPPLTFLALRFLIVGVALLALAPVLGTPLRASPRVVAQQAGVGVLLHAIYLGGVYTAIARGLPAGTAALIVSLQPLCLGALAGPVLGERVGPRAWAGLGLGLGGCALVVAPKLGGGTALAMVSCIFSLLAITGATLVQKRIGGGLDLRTASLIQFMAATIVIVPAALLLEDEPVIWSTEFVVATLWLAFPLSLGAFSILLFLIRQGAASRVASLFFLVPPTTALMAWGAFGERLGPIELAGMVVAALGVALVGWPARRAA